MSLANAVTVNGSKYFSYLKDGEWKNDPLEQQSMFTRTFLPEGTEVKQYDNVSDMVTEITEGGDIDVPDLPAVGTPIVEGELYQDDGNVYRVRQSHNVTAYDPDDIPALFTIYRQESADMEWVRGEQVDVGIIRSQDGVKYECMQAHQTQLVWTPEVTLGVLWKLYVDPEPGIQEWSVGVAYVVDDIVTYEGPEYKCRQSHTSIASWTPPAVLALWLPL